ncbi:unnamed protein product [Phyllotreta striolata]|uniref:Luciferin 4-monooxygenase n=1 Tax=Phyllotreta striolata TaxID=444603 RepID=A0A9N9TPJ2_PHYSR|nr:unnamed protein product [Phyllotreta striolata]
MQEDNDFVIEGPAPVEPLVEETAGQIFWKVLMDNDPQHNIMINAETGAVLTTKTLLEESCKLAQALRIHGCAPQTTLCIGSENNLEYFIPVFASMFAGTITAPLSVNYTDQEIKHILNVTKPRVAFCSKKVAGRYVKLKSEMKFLETVIVTNGDEEVVEGAVNMKEFVEKQLNGKVVSPYKFLPFDGDSKKNVQLILCSSGTTGLPKGVMLTHRNIVTRLLQSRHPEYLSDLNVVLGLMPFFHSYGMIFGLTSIFNRHVTVMMDKFDGDFFLKTIQDYKIPLIRIAPPLAIYLLKNPKVSLYDLSCVQEVFCAAAPLNGKTEAKLKERLNLKSIYQAYGCTEGTLALTITNKDVFRPGSCGRVITYMQCIVRDPDTGRSLGPYEVGELCFKGPTIMKGYYNNPKATAESFTPDGWLRTGDLGYYDNEQYFYVVDRLKELIKYKGYQVAPAELEAVLINHPKVLEAGVVGLPDEFAGELPMAFVVLKDNQQIGEEELKKYVASNVSPQKRLRGGVVFVSSIPKNPSGKILRKELKKKLGEYRKSIPSKL